MFPLCKHAPVVEDRKPNEGRQDNSKTGESHLKKYTAARWNIEKASAEFDINPRTLSARLRQYSIEPGKDGKFSTKQICSARFGDIDNEKLRLTKEQADEKEMSNALQRGELVVKAEVVSLVTGGLQAMVATVLAMTEITIEQREKIIEQLRECGERVARGYKDSDSTAALHGSDLG